MTLLVRHGLMPVTEHDRKALEALDPYTLRAYGLDHALEPFEFGRALFHLNQRRGFKSNRILDGDEDDKEKGKIASGVERLTDALAASGCRTLGEFYARRQTGPVREREAVRVRMQGVGAKALYDFYPARALVEAEFDALWATQARHHPTLLTDAAQSAIREALLFQRPLKRPQVGRCTFEPEPRLATAHLLAQTIRIYQELNHLRIETGLQTENPLNVEQRDVLATHLMSGEDLTFAVMRKILKLDSTARINLEDRKRDKLKGNETAQRFGGKKGALKRLWASLDDSRREAIVARALQETDASAFAAWLQEETDATPKEAAAAAKVRLPPGYARLGPTATAKILAELQNQVIHYAEACKRAGYHHSDERDGVILDPLPYYGEVLARHVMPGTSDPEDPVEKRHGRLANPTVHIGLNQLRKLVNAMRNAWGEPDEIVIELARDLKRSQEEKERADKENAVNQKKNEERVRRIKEAGFADTPLNRTLMRLWEELSECPLGRRCAYTGEEISIRRLLSDEVEIEHILPFSRTLDDSMANKTVAMRGANREKRNQSPHEAFGGNSARFEAILTRAQELPSNKRWRFRPDAMEKFENEERDFLARQLNETRHLSRLAKVYLSKVCDPDHVWVTTGQLTALLRRHWGLNSILRGHNRPEADEKDAKRGRKVRDDHRHHAIDAVVIGAVDRGLLQEISRRAGQHEKDDLDRIVTDMPIPFDNFRDAVRAVVEKIVVSHKPDHGAGGALHEDTAYGVVEGADTEIGNLVRRKPIDALSAKEIDQVRDVRLREALQAVRETVEGDPKALAPALALYGAQHSIRRVRVLKPEKGYVTVKDLRTGAPYKALIPGDNHHIDIVEDANGVWRGFAVTVFQANQKQAPPAWKAALPGAKRVMRVHKGDLIELADPDGQRRIKRVVRLEISANRLRLAEHMEAGQLQDRHEKKKDEFRLDPFEWDFATISKLKNRGAKLVHVDEIGRVLR
ncbi:MAG: type II CRISPR RNA-guided endonuclease Cas9 [Hyphomonadaceae bacterium]|nr:type II CRISPR RNA-guided endonuclease Cas9 [Hyphomonadaceae bacterium]